MPDEPDRVEIVESSLSQSTYMVIWAIASILSFAIFYVYY
tara:strand:- start:1355 stop:1474 length:120 start_codon:yes stop_codon:yes gene_type:complete